jgi:hypothetical protein
MENKIRKLIKTTLDEVINEQQNSSLIEKFKLRVLKDTGVNIVSLRFIKRGKLTKSASFSFMATTDEGVEIGSTSTVSELLKKKEPIEILTGGLYTTGNWEFI